MTGTGLTLASGDDGPYTNIYYSGSGTCVRFTGSGTRGVHGLTCNMMNSVPSCQSGLPAAAICLDTPNNSLEDVSITYTGSTPQPDGILIGSQNNAQDNILINVSGSGLNNVIHISNNTSGAQANCLANACDVTIMGVTNSGSTHTIQDDVTRTTLTDTTLAMYVLGEPGGLNNPLASRFTTSPNAQSWLVGAGQPSGTCQSGALYSCIGSSCSPGTIFGCGVSSWVQIK
jgi:hypothetical protein